MRSKVVVVTCAFLLACSADQDIETTFDPCSPLAIVTGDGTEPHEVQSVEEAVIAWAQVLPTQIEVVAPDAATDAAAAIDIRFDSGDTFYRALYLDSIGVIRVSRDRLAVDDLPLAIAHELGHAFGLLHEDGRESVMNVGNLEIAPTPEDAAAVRALWDSCGD